MVCHYFQFVDCRTDSSPEGIDWFTQSGNIKSTWARSIDKELAAAADTNINGICFQEENGQ